MSYPRYRHHCEDCVFLDNINKRDWYFCPVQTAIPPGTLLVRYDDKEPSNYASMPLKLARKATTEDIAGTDFCDLPVILSEYAHLLPDFEIPKELQFAEELRPQIEECLKHPKAESFRYALVRLRNMSRNFKAPARLYKDFAPLSFGFSVGGFCGGLIFHGAHDGGGNGGAPTFSVNLSPVDGWALHS